MFLSVYLDATPRTCIETQRYSVAADMLNRRVISCTLQHFYPVKRIPSTIGWVSKQIWTPGKRKSPCL